MKKCFKKNNDGLIYRGFASGLNELDKEILSDEMAIIPPFKGRFYLANNEPHMGKVHFEIYNEDSYRHEAIEEYLKNKKDLTNPVYLGISGIQNLNYIAASKASAAILTDINPLQKIFWDYTINLLARCPTMQQFNTAYKDCASDLYAEIQDNISQIDGEEEKQSFSQKFRVIASQPKIIPSITGGILGIEGSSLLRWFGYDQFSEFMDLLNTTRSHYAHKAFEDEESYNHLHQLAKHNSIGALTLDISDTKSNARLKEYLENVKYTPLNASTGQIHTQQQGHMVDLFYGSNATYYAYYTKKGHQEYLAKNHSEPIDWARRALKPNSQSILEKNLNLWLSDRALSIRCESMTKGLISEFIPAIYKRAKTPYTKGKKMARTELQPRAI